MTSLIYPRRLKLAFQRNVHRADLMKLYTHLRAPPAQRRYPAKRSQRHTHFVVLNVRKLLVYLPPQTVFQRVYPVCIRRYRRYPAVLRVLYLQIIAVFAQQTIVHRPRHQCVRRLPTLVLAYLFHMLYHLQVDNRADQPRRRRYAQNHAPQPSETPVFSVPQSCRPLSLHNIPQPMKECKCTKKRTAFTVR